MGAFSNWVKFRDIYGPRIRESGETPDYSLDRWVKMAQDLGKNVDSMVGDARKKEKDLDAEAEKKKKEPKKEPEDSLNLNTDEKEGAWKRLKDIAKAKAEKKFGSKQEDDVEKKHSSSSK